MDESHYCQLSFPMTRAEYKYLNVVLKVAIVIYLGLIKARIVTDI